MAALIVGRRLFLLAKGVAMKTFSLPEQSGGSVTALAWDPTGRYLAGVCDDGMVVVWNVSSGKMIFAHRIARARLLTVTWSEHGRCLAVGGENNAITLLQASDGSVIMSQMFPAPVKKIAFAPRGRRFLVAVGSTIYVYYGARSVPVRLSQPSPVLDVAWSPTGGRFAAVCCHGDVFVYNAVRRRTVYTLTGEDVCEPCAVTWNIDGRDVAIGTGRGTVQVHDGSTGQALTSYSLSAHRISHLAWGNFCLAALDAHAEITLWDLLPREHSGVLAQRYPSLQAFALSPNGEQIATGSLQRVCVASAG
jgi:WD40 repeat protein